MIHYINIAKKRLVGRNNQPNALPLILDFHTLGNIQFCLIDDKNQIRALPENSTLTFAGSVKMGEISQNILFLSTTYTVSEDNVINFTVDTYTEPFLTQIKKKNTEINVEISIKFEDGHQKLLLRDYAYACPRVYIDGLPPTPVESYYTKTQVDDLISDVKDDIPTKTSELINDSGYITSSQIDFSDYYTKEETNAKLDEKADLASLADYQPLSGMSEYALKTDIPSGSTGGSSYSFPLESRTFISTASSLSEDGTIEMQNVDAQYDVDGNNFINNVTFIPSGYPSGILDFQYEEVSGFVYNPFTTFKFQIPYMYVNNAFLREVSVIVERDEEETIIATTNGLDDNSVIRYNDSYSENNISFLQVITLKNILEEEFKSISGDKLKLRLFFTYWYYGKPNQQNAPHGITGSIYTGTSKYNQYVSNRYGFFLSVNKDFKNPFLPDKAYEYITGLNGIDLSGYKNSLSLASKRLNDVLVDFDQYRLLSLAVNNTGIFGKLKDGVYDSLKDYHYNFDTYLDGYSDVYLYSLMGYLYDFSDSFGQRWNNQRIYSK